jgi:phosphate transport system substrate-binding protein
MKKIFWLITFSVLLIVANAQTGSVIKITGTKFPFDIMQQWIDAYSKTHPGVQFQLSKAISPDSADLMIAAHAFRPGELKNDQVIIALNRYAQLPIVNSQRSDLQALQQKGFTQADLKNIYFNQNGELHTKGFTDPLNVYRRNKNVCASRSFAENVTGSQLDVAGTLVNGDDRALSAAVKKDINGISYNNLGLIYNLQTRKVLDSIAIIPIDFNEDGKIDSDENIYGTLDNVLNYLNATRNIPIPQDNVNIVFNRNTISKEALSFLQWIITNGQAYNRSYGFLNLDQSVVANEQQLLNGLSKDKALTRNN